MTMDAAAMRRPFGAQAGVDSFHGEWSSRFPHAFPVASGGHAFLFEDRRLRWFLARLRGINRMDALELGPLEGGHAWMLEQAGIRSTTSVEANGRAFLKCLVVKQLFDLRRTRFLHGDFLEYLAGSSRCWQLGLASGVLYHMRDPMRLIALLVGRCRDLLVWTHYHDPERARSDPRLAATLGAPETVERHGFRHTLVPKHYGDTLGWAGFCGGSADWCAWMLREELLGAFEHVGFKVQAIAFDRRDHPNGAALALHLRGA